MKSNTTDLLKEHILEAHARTVYEVPWWSKQVKTAVRTKQSAFKKFKATYLSIIIATKSAETKLRMRCVKQGRTMKISLLLTLRHYKPPPLILNVPLSQDGKS